MLTMAYAANISPSCKLVLNSEVILDYLPVQTIDLDLVFSDEEDLNLAPTRPQSNCD